MLIPSLVLSTVALGLALSSLSLKTVPFGLEGEDLTIVGYGIGYYLWLLSIVILMLCDILACVFLRIPEQAVSEYSGEYRKEDTQQTALRKRHFRSKTTGIVCIVLGGIITAFAVLLFVQVRMTFTRVESVANAMMAIKSAEVSMKAREGAYIDCGNSEAIRSKLGVNVDMQYVSWIKVKDGGISVFLRDIDPKVDGTMLTLMPAADGGAWSWGGTISGTYLRHIQRTEKQIRE